METPWLTNFDREAHAPGRLDVLSAWAIIKSEVPLFGWKRRVYAMCERFPLGLPHTQNRVSGRPRVADMFLMRSPQTLSESVCVTVFITTVPIIKLFARGEGDSGGHVLRETTSRGLCVCLLLQ
jgi:hypothetical protein